MSLTIQSQHKQFYMFVVQHVYCKQTIYLNFVILVAQWLERLTGHQKVAGLIPVWVSEIVFLRIELDDCSSIISRYLQAPTLLKYKSRQYHY